MTTLNEISGVINSPFYPRHYSTNQSCSWEIRARKGKRVIFTIEDMDFSWWCSRVWYERQQKDFLKFISNSHIILWFYFSFIRNQSVNIFIKHHRVSPSKTISDFRPKWAKPITVFKPKRRKNRTNFFLKDNNLNNHSWFPHFPSVLQS